MPIKGLRYRLAAGLLGLLTGAAVAETPRPDSERVGRDEPRFLTAAPPDHCDYEMARRDAPGLEASGYVPGLGPATVPLAIYVPCAALAEAARGVAGVLGDWVAIEKNVVTFPSDDDRLIGGRGAVDLLCRDAQDASTGHGARPGPLAEKAALALTSVGPDLPVRFLGVIASEPDACFIAAARFEAAEGQTGEGRRFFVVTGFMELADRWVYVTVRRRAMTGGSGEADAPGAVAEASLALASGTAGRFLALNR